jgi:hypothetical protein
VVELRGDLHFAEEPVGTEGGGQLRPHDLDGHLAIVLPILGEIDGRHPALAQHPLQVVALSECPSDPGEVMDAGGGGPGRDARLGGRGGPALGAEVRAFREQGVAGMTGAQRGSQERLRRAALLIGISQK